ncbi:flagellar export protein FliJ [Bacillus sp. C1-1]|nr:flagellar export protein FliJ [Bacillus sp. C1-1]
MTFSFSLQQVMDVKKHDQIQAKKQVDLARDSFERTATSLYERLKEKETLEKSVQSNQALGMKVSECVQTALYLSQLEKVILKMKDETDHARMEMQKREEQFQLTARSHKQFERLKERQAQQYEQDERKREQQQMDEISVNQFNRVLIG